eukprot:789085-Amphidinium_carterae.1
MRPKFVNVGGKHHRSAHHRNTRDYWMVATSTGYWCLTVCAGHVSKEFVAAELLPGEAHGGRGLDCGCSA